MDNIPKYQWRIKKNKKDGTSKKDELIVNTNRKYDCIGTMLSSHEEAQKILIDFLEEKIHHCYNEVMPLLEKGETDKAKNLSILVIAYEDLRRLILASVNYIKKKV